jgi:hypothetical protein
MKGKNYYSDISKELFELSRTPAIRTIALVGGLLLLYNGMSVIRGGDFYLGAAEDMIGVAAFGHSISR